VSEVTKGTYGTGHMGLYLLLAIMLLSYVFVLWLQDR
jgi:hypothetical protein